MCRPRVRQRPGSARGERSWPIRTGEGQRLYRGGDYGRWLPEGKLEFLGRRDTQVKISGFDRDRRDREHTVAGARRPRRRSGGERAADQSKHLVAFYSGQRPLDANVLRDRLGESLPEYMVPSAYHWRESLPLTANGKIDRKALTAIAGELDVAEPGPRRAEYGDRAPAGGRMGGRARHPEGPDRPRDHFFDLGGTSLSAVKLVISLERAVSFNDLTGHPILADLAALIDGRSERRSGLPSHCRNRTVRRRVPWCASLRRRQRGELPADGRRAGGAAGWRSTPSSCPVTTWPPSASRSRRWHRWSSRSLTR